MSLILSLCILFVSGFLGIIFLAEYFCHDFSGKPGAILISIFIGFLVWVLISGFQPYKVLKTIEVQSKSVDNSAIIAYNDVDGTLKIINLNKELNKNVPDNSRVSVTIFSKWYAGIYYDTKGMVEDKYEVAVQSEGNK